jgi:predicted PurR-regulated permease PerM
MRRPGIHLRWPDENGVLAVAVAQVRKPGLDPAVQMAGRPPFLGLRHQWPVIGGQRAGMFELAGLTEEIAEFLPGLHLAAWAQRNAPKLHSLAASLAKPALSVGKGAASVLARLATIAALVLLLLLEAPRMRQGLLGLMSPRRAARYTRVARQINQSVTGYVLGDLLTSLIAGVVIFITLAALGVPFPFLWALWVALVDFLPMIGGALAGIPTVLFATGHSLTAGIVTAAAFVGYQQLENRILNPVVMSRTVRVNPLLILLSILIGSSIGDWLGGFSGGFVAALLSIPCAAALQVIVKELWQATAPGGALGGEPEPDAVRD